MLIVNTFENIHLKCIPPFRFLNTPMARLIRTSTVDLSMLTNERVCYYFYILKNRNFDNFNTSVNWVTTADGCVHTVDTTQLNCCRQICSDSSRLSPIVSNSVHTVDATELDSTTAESRRRRRCVLYWALETTVNADIDGLSMTSTINVELNRACTA